jgi:hypothetical protein
VIPHRELPCLVPRSVSFLFGQLMSWMWANMRSLDRGSLKRKKMSDSVSCDVLVVGILGGPRPIEAGFPENPHPLKTGQGGRDRRRHGGLDFRLPDTELSNVEIDKQAGAAGV